MANAEKLITLILLLVLLHLFRPGKKHVFLLGPFYIVSETYLAQPPTQMFLGYCHVLLPLILWGGLRDEPNLLIDSSK